MGEFEKYILQTTENKKTVDHEVSLPFRIGRSDDNDLVLKDASVSKTHAKIKRRGQEVIVEDLGSANGTFVNGHRVTSRALENGDRIMFASVECRFIAQQGKEAGADEKTAGAATGELADQYESAVTDDGGQAAHQPLAQRLMARVDKVFVPLYRQTFAKIAFPLILVPFVILIFIILIALTLSPQLEENQRVLQQEAEKRAVLLAKRIIDINRPFLDQNQDHMLSVAAVENDPTVIEALIIRPDGKIMSPDQRYGQIVSRAELLRAARAESTYANVYSATGVVAAEPVFRFSQAKGANEVYALGVVRVATGAHVRGAGAALALWFQIGLFVVMAGLVVAFLFIRIFTQPWKDIEAQIEGAIRQERSSVPLVMNFAPVERATKMINSILYRLFEERGAAAPAEGDQADIKSGPDHTYFVCSDLGDILNRHIDARDQGWMSEVLPGAEEAPSLTALSESIQTWFDEAKTQLEDRASAFRVFEEAQCACVLMRQASQYVVTICRV